MTAADERGGLVRALAGDGTPLLVLGSLGLVGAGLFAWFLALTDQLLPHDVAWLTVTVEELRAVADGRVLEFMHHDRAAFGGTLVAIGVLYLWLVRFPIARGEAWAWWTVAVSAALGFLSFLTYLGTGYLDSWHGVATLVLLPLFGAGLWLTRARLHGPIDWRRWNADARAGADRSALVGRFLVLLTGFGMLVAGLTISTVGTAVVFVPQDLEFLELDRAALDAIDPRLVPLIAHDRAGFGGGLATTGIVAMSIMWFGRPSRALWEALLLSGIAGFGAAVGVHLVIDYTEITHVGPAVFAALLYAAGMVVTFPSFVRAGS